MPKAKKTSKAKKVARSMEQALWDSANKLRGKVESSEYKHVVLALIFLKFASDKFEARRRELIADGKEKYLDRPEFYNAKGVFFLPEEARWSYVMQHAKQEDIAIKIDTALHTVEKNNPALKDALPDNYFSRLDLDTAKVGALLDTINNIDTAAEGSDAMGSRGSDTEQDIIGRVYEYFLGRFAAAEGKGGGEFYTPKSIVNLLAEMLEPFEGKIYDPCCGSGGMFVQSLKFVESHKGNRANVSIYGQEYTTTTRKLAKMNLAVRGITANLGESAANTFLDDQHPDLKADYILANPPFNQKQWRGENELTKDPRWGKYGAPTTSNANYAWILHMLSKLSDRGTAGFVLANGSMSSQQNGEGSLRQNLLEDDLIDCMVALPGQLFYTTQIPVCLWFMSRNRHPETRGTNQSRHPETRGTNQSRHPETRGTSQSRHPETRGTSWREDPGTGTPTSSPHSRTGNVLFIDARQLGSMISRTHKELTQEDITRIASTYHNWKRGEDYEDVAGFCKSASLEEIAKNDYVLTPGRYVGIPEEPEDSVPFEEKMASLSAKLREQLAEGRRLGEEIEGVLEGFGV